MGESLGQQFVVDNRPGAAGSIGAEVVAKAPPDGYTLMVHSTTHVGNAHLRQGRLRPLGVGSAQRAKALPDVPTISESDVSGYEMAPWVGMFAPAGTPRFIIDRLIQLTGARIE